MKSEIFKIKAMTERVVQQDHSERAVYGGSGLWEYCMKTIPEPRAEEAKKLRSVAVQLRYKQRVKDKVEPCAGTLRYADT